MQPTCSPTDVPPVSSSEGVVVMGGEGVDWVVKGSRSHEWWY